MYEYITSEYLDFLHLGIKKRKGEVMRALRPYQIVHTLRKASGP